MATGTKDRPYLTVKQFADEIGVSKSAAYRLVADGAVRVSNVASRGRGSGRVRLRITRANLERFIADRELSIPPRQRRPL